MTPRRRPTLPQPAAKLLARMLIRQQEQHVWTVAEIETLLPPADRWGFADDGITRTTVTVAETLEVLLRAQLISYTDDNAVRLDIAT